MFPFLANGLYITSMLSAAALGETHAVSKNQEEKQSAERVSYRILGTFYMLNIEVETLKVDTSAYYLWDLRGFYPTEEWEWEGERNGREIGMGRREREE
jgi:hypothetical protein